MNIRIVAVEEEPNSCSCAVVLNGCQVYETNKSLMNRHNVLLLSCIYEKVTGGQTTSCEIGQACNRCF